MITLPDRTAIGPSEVIFAPVTSSIKVAKNRMYQTSFLIFTFHVKEINELTQTNLTNF